MEVLTFLEQSNCAFSWTHKDVTSRISLDSFVEFLARSESKIGIPCACPHVLSVNLVQGD